MQRFIHNLHLKLLRSSGGEFDFHPTEIESVEVTTFLTAYHIVGGGLYGDRKEVHSKEQADHSLPYVLAVLLLDG